MVDGRYPKGLFLEAFGGPHEEAFAAWLQRTRMPDVVSTRWAETGTLYESIGPDDEGPTYLVVFETDRWDLEDIIDELEPPSGDAVQGRLEDSSHQSGWSRILRRCGPPVPIEQSGFFADGRSDTATTGLLVVWSRFTSAETEKPFNIWYNRRGVPAQVGEGTFARGYRYACAYREDSGERRFAAMYETDADDAATAIAAFLSAHGPVGAPGLDVPDYVDVLEHAVFLPVRMPQ